MCCAEAAAGDSGGSRGPPSCVRKDQSVSITPQHCGKAAEPSENERSIYCSALTFRLMCGWGVGLLGQHGCLSVDVLGVAVACCDSNGGVLI